MLCLSTSCIIFSVSLKKSTVETRKLGINKYVIQSTDYSSFQSKKKLPHVIRLSPTNGRFIQIKPLNLKNVVATIIHCSFSQLKKYSKNFLFTFC